MDRKLIQKVLNEFFPAGSSESGVTFEIVPETVVVEGDEVRATFRLFEWDTSDATPMIASVKEQEVLVARLEHLQDLGRYRSFLESVRERIEALTPEETTRSMPRDLVDVDLLDTTDATTPEEFRTGGTPETISPTRHLGGESPTFVNQIQALTFRREAPEIVVLSGHGELGAWNFEKGSWGEVVRDHRFSPLSLLEAPNGALLGTCVGGVQLWDPETGERVVLGDESYNYPDRWEIRECFLRGTRGSSPTRKRAGRATR